MNTINRILLFNPTLLLTDKDIQSQLLNSEGELINEAKNGYIETVYMGLCQHCHIAPCIKYKDFPDYREYNKLWNEYERQRDDLRDTYGDSDTDDDNDIVHYIERVQYNDLFYYRRAEYKGILKAYDLYKREKIRSILDKNTILYNDLINIILDFV
jgi:hypothetical protein